MCILRDAAFLTTLGKAAVMSKSEELREGTAVCLHMPPPPSHGKMA